MRKYYSHISRRMSSKLKICILLFIIRVRWKLFFGVLKKKWNICFYYSGGAKKGYYRTLNRFVYMNTQAQGYTCNEENHYKVIILTYFPLVCRIFHSSVVRASACSFESRRFESQSYLLFILFFFFKIHARSNLPSASVFERFIFNTGL